MISIIYFDIHLCSELCEHLLKLNTYFLRLANVYFFFFSICFEFFKFNFLILSDGSSTHIYNSLKYGSSHSLHTEKSTNAYRNEIINYFELRMYFISFFINFLIHIKPYNSIKMDQSGFQNLLQPTKDFFFSIIT